MFGVDERQNPAYHLESVFISEVFDVLFFYSCCYSASRIVRA